MQYIRYIWHIYIIYYIKDIKYIYNLYAFFRTQPGIEPGHPRTLYPDDVIRNTIGHVGHPIYVVNEVLFINHSLLTLHIYAIYKIYTIYITYKIYNTYIRCMLFFRTQPGIDAGHPRTLYRDDVIRNTIGHVGHPIYVVNEVLFIPRTFVSTYICNI